MESQTPLTPKEFRKRYRKHMWEDRKENFAWFIFLLIPYVFVPLLFYFLIEAIREAIRYFFK